MRSWPITKWTPQPPYTVGQIIQSDLPEVDKYTYQAKSTLQRFRVKAVNEQGGYDLEPVNG